MKKYDAILFDLDGTLLPMDYETFMKAYFKLLASAVAPCGYSYETLIPAMWKGVGAMVKNDGEMSNSERFWDVFSGIYGQRVFNDIPVFNAFYRTDFHKAMSATSPTPLARRIVDAARANAEKVILATNPLFPRVAIEARLSWAGLTCDDFDLVTDYDNSGFCKPNPQYFTDIAEKTGIDPQNSLMVGNNTVEDAEASMKAGFSCYLITDCLISEGEMPDCPSGTFADAVAYIEK